MENRVNRLVMTVVLFLVLASWGSTQEPVPIQRVLIDPERLPQELERARQGRFVTLSREDFEERVRLSSPSATGNRNANRITESRYQAVLDHQALIGSASWKFSSGNVFPSLLPVGSLNLALRNPPGKGRPPVPIGEFDSKTTAVLLQKKDQGQPIDFFWSRAGEIRGEGITFELKIPATSISSLDLFLPANWTVTVNEGTLLNGPVPLPAFPGEKGKAGTKANPDNPDELPWGVNFSPPFKELLQEEPVLEKSLGQDGRIWSLQASGKERLVFTLRKSDRPGTGRVLVNRQVTSQKILPDGLESAFELDLTSLNQGIQKITCQLDPGLRPYSVSMRNLKTWEFQPGQGRDQPSQLLLHLKEPIHEGLLKISCLGTLGEPGKSGEPIPWTSPGLRVAGAVPRGENLMIRVHPDVRLEQWQSNGFHLLESLKDREGEDGISWHRLVLEGGGIQPENNAKIRPTASVRPHAVGYRTRQLAWWQLGLNRQTLTVQIDYQVEAGRLFQLPVEIPPGWDVDRVEMMPAILQPGWQPIRSGNPRLLVVDLARPLSAASSMKPFGDGESPGSRGTLKLVLTTTTARLKLSQPDRAGAITFPLPESVPQNASWKEGILGISLDPILHSVGNGPTVAAASSDGEGPWGPTIPDLVVPLGSQPGKRTITVARKPPQLRCRTTTLVAINSPRTKIATKLALRLESGFMESVDFQIENHPFSAWTWEIAPPGESGGLPLGQTLKTERLSLRDELVAATSLVGTLAGTGPVSPRFLTTIGIPKPTWRLTFGKPLIAGQSLDILGSSEIFFPQDSLHPTIIPTIQVPRAYRNPGEIHLIHNTTEEVLVRARDMEEVPQPQGEPLIESLSIFGGSTGSGLPDIPALPIASGKIWRSFQTNRLPGRLELVVSDKAINKGNPTREGKVLSPQLSLQLDPTGLLEHHARFSLEHWSDSTIPVSLPDNSKLLAIAVDGVWLNLPPGRVEKSDSAQYFRIDLPVPRQRNSIPEDSTAGDRPTAVRNRNLSHYEIVYLRPVPSYWFWNTVEAIFPLLPVKIPSIQYHWKLPESLQVLDGSVQSAAQGSPFAWFRNWMTRSSSSSLAGLPAWSVGPDFRREAQREPTTLFELVDRLAGLAARDHRFLILDLNAVGDLGIGDELAIDSPGDGFTGPLEKLHLKTLIFPGVVLLTSQDRSQGFNLEDEDLAKSIQEASVHGIDATQQFQNALDWLVQNPMAATQQNSLLDHFFQPMGNALAGYDLLAGPRLTLIPVRILHGITIALTLVLSVCTLGFRRKSPVGGLIFLLGWLGIAGLIWLWFPVGTVPFVLIPLITGTVFLGLIYGMSIFRSGASAEDSSSKDKRSGSGSNATRIAVTAFLLVVSLAGGQTGTSPTTVYLLPSEGPGGGQILVPPELLEKLSSSQRVPGQEPTVPGVLLSSRYECQATPGTVKVEAVFSAVTFQPDATLLLPLENIYLNGLIWLDDARVSVEPVEKTRDRPAGLAIKIKEKGTHKIEIHFDIPVIPLTNRSQDRTFRVNLPRVIHGQFRLRVPPEAASILALGPLGWQQVSPGDKEQPGLLLQADLGLMDGPLQVTWFQKQGLEQNPGKVQYEEAYLWDLRGDGGNLTGLIHYRITEGTTRSLLIHVPGGLEVRNVEAFRAVISPSKILEPILDGSVLLEKWQLTGEGNDRNLEIIFQNPITGDLGVSVNLVPGSILPSRLSLPVPASHGEPLPGPGYLAYHAQGLEVKRTNLIRASAINSVDFAPFWPLSSRPPVRTLDFCSRYGREGGQPPLLELSLAWQAGAVGVEQDIKLQFGPMECEVRNRLQITSPREDLSRIEIPIDHPNHRVTAVTGSEVLHWNQSAGQLAIWLNRTVRKTALEITVLVPLGINRAQGNLEIPRLLPVDTSTVHTVCHLRAEMGVQIQLDTNQGLKALSTPNLSPPNRDYESQDINWGGVIGFTSVNAATLRAGGCRLLTFLEEVDQSLQVTTTILYRLAKGESRSIQVHLRDWPVPAIDLVPSDLRFKVLSADREGFLVVIDLPAGSDELQHLTIRGQSNRARLRRKGFWLPGVTVKGLANSESWVAIAGDDLQVDLINKLSPTPLASILQNWSIAGLARGWAREIERLQRVGGQVWQIGGDFPGFYIRPRSTSQNPQIQVLLQEQQVLWTEELQWQHETIWWLAVSDSPLATVILPRSGQVLSVTVDGSTITPQIGRPGVLTIPLNDWDGYRMLVVRWRYDKDQETLRHPLMELPTLNQMIPGPVLWTLRVPSNSVLKNGSGRMLLRDDRESAVLQSLYRCRTQARILSDPDSYSSRLNGRSTRQLAESRLGFWQHLAELDLELLDKKNLSGPEGQTLDHWFAQIKSLGVPPTAVGDALMPTRFEGERGQTGHVYRGVSLDSKQPEVTIDSTESTYRLPRILLSAQWLGFLAAILVLSRFAGVAWLFRLTWPEQMGCLGLFLLLTPGFNTSGVVVLILAVLARLRILMRRFLVIARA